MPARAHHFPRAAAGVFRHNALDLGMLLEKTPALSQRHRVRLHRAHLFHFGPWRPNQVMRNRQNHFRDDMQLALEQQVVTAIHRSRQAVFEGRDD
mgnify:CR=1 FL=1